MKKLISFIVCTFILIFAPYFNTNELNAMEPNKYEETMQKIPPKYRAVINEMVYQIYQYFKNAPYPKNSEDSNLLLDDLEPLINYFSQFLPMEDAYAYIFTYPETGDAGFHLIIVLGNEMKGNTFNLKFNIKEIKTANNKVLV